MQLGCGRFSESEWSTYLTAPEAERQLAAHLQTCRTCAAYAAELRRTEQLLRRLGPEERIVRRTAARAVLAELKDSYIERAAAGTDAPQPSRRFLPAWGRFIGSVAALGTLMLVLAWNGWLPGQSTTPAEPIVTYSTGMAVEDGAMAGESLFMPMMLMSARQPQLTLSRGMSEGSEGEPVPTEILATLTRDTTAFYSLVHLELPPGKHKVDLSIMDPHQMVIAHTEIDVEAGEDDRSLTPIAAAWRDVAFSTPGEHTLRISVDGEEAHLLPFYVE